MNQFESAGIDLLGAYSEHLAISHGEQEARKIVDKLFIKFGRHVIAAASSDCKIGLDTIDFSPLDALRHQLSIVSDAVAAAAQVAVVDPNDDVADRPDRIALLEGSVKASFGIDESSRAPVSSRTAAIMEKVKDGARRRFEGFMDPYRALHGRLTEH